MIFEEESSEETPPPGDYIEEGEEAKEFGFVEMENESEKTKLNDFFSQKHRLS